MEKVRINTVIKRRVYRLRFSFISCAARFVLRWTFDVTSRATACGERSRTTTALRVSYIRVNLGNLWLKIVQSKITNYAKQTQFPEKSNGCIISINNELQRKMRNGHLVKTNPIKANFPPFHFRCTSAQIYGIVFQKKLVL